MLEENVEDQMPQENAAFPVAAWHNSLALRVNLRRRGMRLDTVCVQSGRLDEDGVHLFFKCKKVRQIWNALQLEHIRVQSFSSSN
jgi:hypothetical protein